MRVPRTLTLILTLMLAAAIPLRGYAAMAQCEGSASAAVHIGHAAQLNAYDISPGSSTPKGSVAYLWEGAPPPVSR